MNCLPRRAWRLLSPAPLWHCPRSQCQRAARRFSCMAAKQQQQQQQQQRRRVVTPNNGPGALRLQAQEPDHLVDWPSQSDCPGGPVTEQRPGSTPLSIILGTVALSYGSVPMYKMVRVGLFSLRARASSPADSRRRYARRRASAASPCELRHTAAAAARDVARRLEPVTGAKRIA